MGILKNWENELMAEWHRLQLEKVPHLKALLIRAYYVNFRLYQSQKKHLSVLAS